MRALVFGADLAHRPVPQELSRGKEVSVLGLGHRPVQSRPVRQVRASIPAACLHTDHWHRPATT